MKKIKWDKKGKIFEQTGNGIFKSHATRPVPVKLNERVLRIFFTSRDDDDMPLPTFIDVNIENPSELLSVNKKKMIDFGQPGAFDDSGVTIGSIIYDHGKVMAYYSGWKRRRFKVTIEMSIGLLEFDEQLSTLTKVYEGPILAQDKEHPFLVCAPFAIHDGVYKMWYCSGTGWEQVGEKPEMMYRINYAESEDGIDWKVKSSPAVDYAYHGEVLSSPWVIKGEKDWHMWYSVRGITKKKYVAGYAASPDGVHWTRFDDKAGLEVSDNGWDSEMACYPAFFTHKDFTYMFYSGNNVGKGGLGYAVSKNIFL